MTIKSVLRVACVVGIGLAVGVAEAQSFTESFEDEEPGAFPGDPWVDAAGMIDEPTVLAPTGSVISTLARDRQVSKAFQIHRHDGTSSGLLHGIAEADSHRVAADVRIDHHASEYPFNVWTAAIGFFKVDSEPDFNFEAQSIVFVFERRWHFFSFGGPGTTGFTMVRLSDDEVVEGAWYGVGFGVDTTIGRFDVRIESADGELVADRVIDVDGWNPIAGRYNRVAIFDGEYAEVAEGGQFSVDNVRYAPALER